MISRRLIVFFAFIYWFRNQLIRSSSSSASSLDCLFIYFRRKYFPPRADIAWTVCPTTRILKLKIQCFVLDIVGAAHSIFSEQWEKELGRLGRRVLTSNYNRLYVYRAYCWLPIAKTLNTHTHTNLTWCDKVWRTKCGDISSKKSHFLFSYSVIHAANEKARLYALYVYQFSITCTRDEHSQRECGWLVGDGRISEEGNIGFFLSLSISLSPLMVSYR